MFGENSRGVAGCKFDLWYSVIPEGYTPRGAARGTDPETSHVAAKTVNVTYLEGQVYNAIKATGFLGATQDELAAALGLPTNTITPRFKPLLRKEAVFDAGFTRKGASGKRQRVLMAAAGVTVKAAESTAGMLREAEVEISRAQARKAIQSIEATIETLRKEAASIAVEHGIN
jgi:hypothetical protein